MVTEKWKRDNINKIRDNLLTFSEDITEYLDIHDNGRGYQFEIISQAFNSQNDVKDHIFKEYDNKNSILRKISDKIGLNKNDLLTPESIFVLVNYYNMNFSKDIKYFKSEPLFSEKLNYENYYSSGGNKTLYLIHFLFKINILSFEYSINEYSLTSMVINGFNDYDIPNDNKPLKEEDKNFKNNIGINNPFILIINDNKNYYYRLLYSKNDKDIKNFTTLLILYYNCFDNDIQIHDIVNGFKIFDRFKELNTYLYDNNSKTKKTNPLINFKSSEPINSEVEDNIKNGTIPKFLDTNKSQTTQIIQKKELLPTSDEIILDDKGKIKYKPPNILVIDSKEYKYIDIFDIFYINIGTHLPKEKHVLIDLTDRKIKLYGRSHIFIRLGTNTYILYIKPDIDKKLGNPFTNVKESNINFDFFEKINFIEFIIKLIMTETKTLIENNFTTFNISIQTKYSNIISTSLNEIDNIIKKTRNKFENTFENKPKNFEQQKTLIQTKKPYGFPNIGATCYLNAILNLLRSELLQNIFKTGSIFEILKDIVENNEKKQLTPKEMELYIIRLEQKLGFKLNCQSDVNDFLKNIFKHSGDDIKKYFFIFDEIKTITTSNNIERVENNNTYLSYYIALTGLGKSVQELINNYFTFSIVNKENKNIVTKIIYGQYPNCCMFAGPVDRKIKLDEEIELQEENKKIKFIRQSIIIRTGDKLGKFGHYTSIIKKDNKWYGLNDDIVEEYKGDFNLIFYLALYEREKRISII